MNLLQPQDRRSLSAGDSKDIVEARGRLIRGGIGRLLIENIAKAAHRVDGLAPGAIVADLGSGTGDALAALAESWDLDGVGIDLSAAAAAHAARSFPRLTWVVANADRQIPLVDHSASLILSLHARRHPAECRRTLRERGALVVAVPAADDLIELRAAVQGHGVSRSRLEAVIQEHETGFEVVEAWSVRETRTVNPEGLQDLLRITYRGARRQSTARVESLIEMPVTLASDVVLFRRR